MNALLNAAGLLGLLISHSTAASEDIVALPLNGTWRGTVAGQEVKATAVGRTRFVPARGGQGLLLDREGAVKLPLGDRWPVPEGCAELWIQPRFRGADKNRYWLLCDDQKRFRLFKYSNGRLYFQVRCDDRGVNCAATCRWQPGEWRHVAMAWRNFNSGRDDGLMMLFVDGQLVATTAGKFTISKVGPALLIGSDPKGEHGADAVVVDFRLRGQAKVTYAVDQAKATANNRDDYALAALGATVQASSQIASFRGKAYLALNAIDGKVAGGYWCTDFPHGAKPPHWVEVDLGEQRRVGKIVLHMVKRETALLDRFRIEAEVNGDWRSIGEAKGYQASMSSIGNAARYRAPFGKFAVTLAEPVHTRRVRVTIDAPGIARLHEIEVLPPSPQAALKRPRRDAAGPVLCFDLGAAQSPVDKHWLPLTADMARDDWYGWTRPDGLLGVDRLEGYAVTRDGIAGLAATGTMKHGFAVDVPPGRYAVAVAAGDLDAPVPRFRILAEGKEVAARVGSSDRGAWDVQTFCVEVADRALDLAFETEQAWYVSAIVVAPQDRFGDVQALVEQVEDWFAKRDAALLAGLRERRPEETSGPLALTPARQARGYEVFTRPYLDKIFPTTAPDEAAVCRELHIAATAGEYEPTTLAVRAFRALRKVRVLPGPLSGPAGTLPAAAVQIKAVRCWPQIEDKWNADEYMVMPEMLEPQGRHGELWLRANRTKQFWVTVSVPSDTGAGLYTGRLRVGAANAPSVDVALKLTVYPFSLKWPQPMAWGTYYYPIEARGDAQVLADLRNMRSHGLNTFSFSAGRAIDFATGQYDLTHIQWVMGLTERVGGFDGPFPLYIGGNWEKEDFTDARRDLLVGFVKALEAERRERGWLEFLYYPVDEPFAGPRLEGALPPYRACKQVPGIRTYCTVSGLAAQTLAPFLDVRCHAPTVANGFHWPQVWREAVKDGDEFWWYSNSTREYYDVMRFKAGFFHWKVRATGQTYWHFRAPIATAFCDFDGGHRDHISVYPGLDGPIDTIQWECQREGIDDAKYAWTLELMLAEAKKAAVPGAALARAQKTLEEVRESANVDMAYYDKKYPRKYAFHYYAEWPAERFDQQRARIAAAIAELSPAMR